MMILLFPSGLYPINLSTHHATLQVASKVQVVPVRRTDTLSVNRIALLVQIIASSCCTKDHRVVTSVEYAG